MQPDGTNGIDMQQRLQQLQSNTLRGSFTQQQPQQQQQQQSASLQQLMMQQTNSNSNNNTNWNDSNSRLFMNATNPQMVQALLQQQQQLGNSMQRPIQSGLSRGVSGGGNLNPQQQQQFLLQQQLLQSQQQQQQQQQLRNSAMMNQSGFTNSTFAGQANFPGQSNQQQMNTLRQQQQQLMQMQLDVSGSSKLSLTDSRLDSADTNPISLSQADAFFDAGSLNTSLNSGATGMGSMNSLGMMNSNSMGMNTAGMSTMGMNTTGMNPSGMNNLGLNATGMNTTGMNTSGLNSTEMNLGLNTASMGMNTIGMNSNSMGMTNAMGMSSSHGMPAPTSTMGNTNPSGLGSLGGNSGSLGGMGAFGMPPSGGMGSRSSSITAPSPGMSGASSGLGGPSPALGSVQFGAQVGSMGGTNNTMGNSNMTTSTNTMGNAPSNMHAIGNAPTGMGGPPTSLRNSFSMTNPSSSVGSTNSHAPSPALGSVSSNLGSTDPLTGTLPTNNSQGMMSSTSRKSPFEADSNGARGPVEAFSRSASVGTTDMGRGMDGQQKAFLDGQFAGGWQSNADLDDRRKVIVSILHVISQMRPDTSKLSNKLPTMAKSLEEHLYRAAKSKDDYMNPATLRRRLQAIAHGLELHRVDGPATAFPPASADPNARSSNMPNASNPNMNWNISSALSNANATRNPSVSGLVPGIGSSIGNSQNSSFVGMQQQTGSSLTGGSMHSGSSMGSQGNTGMGSMQGMSSFPQGQGGGFSQAQHPGATGSTPDPGPMAAQAGAMMGTQGSALQNAMGSSGVPPSSSVGGKPDMHGLQQGSSSGAQGSSLSTGDSSSKISDPSQAADQKKVIFQQQQRLILLRHASKCKAGPSCPTKFCGQMVKLWKHMKHCRDRDCKTPHCLSSRCVLNHYRICKAEGKTATCKVCGPVMMKIKQQERGNTPSEEQQSSNQIPNQKSQAPSNMVVNMNQGQNLDARQTHVKSQLDSLKNLQKQQQQLHEQQRSIEGQAKMITDPQSKRAQDLREKHRLLQQLQARVQQQQMFIQQELVKAPMSLSNMGSGVQQQSNLLQQQVNIQQANLQQSQQSMLQQQASMQQQQQQQQLPGIQQQPGIQQHLSTLQQHSALQQQLSMQHQLQNSHLASLQAQQLASPAISGTLHAAQQAQLRRGSLGKGKRLGKLKKDGTKKKRTSIKQTDRSAKKLKAASKMMPIVKPKAEGIKENTEQSKPTVDDTRTSIVRCMTKTEIQSHLDSLNKRIVLASRTVTHKCRPLIQDLIDDQFGWVFRDAVDPVALGLPDYFDVIKNPMHLELVKKKLENAIYSDLESFASDTRLVFENAILYNGESSDVGELAANMLSQFNAAFDAMVREVENSHLKLENQGELCSLCGLQKRKFEPTVLYCQGSCNQRIKRNTTYFTDRTKANHWCDTCYSTLKDDEPVVLDDGTTVKKSDLQDFKNDGVDEEGWVNCDECHSWVHQVCALFNGRTNKSNAKYTCPKCVLKKNDTPLQKTVKGASELPRCKLSDSIESGIEEALRLAYETRAAELNVPMEEVEKAENLSVRVVSHIEKKHLIGLKAGKKGAPVERPGDPSDVIMTRIGQNLLKMKDNFIVAHLRSRRFAGAVERGEDVSDWKEDSDDEVIRSKRAKITGKGAVGPPEQLNMDFNAIKSMEAESNKVMTEVPIGLTESQLDSAPVTDSTLPKAEVVPAPGAPAADSVSDPKNEQNPVLDVPVTEPSAITTLPSELVVARACPFSEALASDPIADSKMTQVPVPEITSTEADGEVEVKPKHLTTDATDSVSESEAVPGERPSPMVDEHLADTTVKSGTPPSSETNVGLPAVSLETNVVETSTPEATAVDIEEPASCDRNPSTEAKVLSPEVASLGSNPKSIAAPDLKDDPTDAVVSKVETEQTDASRFLNPVCEPVRSELEQMTTSLQVDPVDDTTTTTAPVAVENQVKQEHTEAGKALGDVMGGQPVGGMDVERLSESEANAVDGVVKMDVEQSLESGPVATQPTPMEVGEESEGNQAALDASKAAVLKHIAAIGGPCTIVDDTTDEDSPFESDMFESRQQFLNYCQTNHCQFDELRRAKHSSLMVLFQLHNPSAPKFLQQCGACYRDITHGMRYHCNQCSNFDLCEECYEPVTTGLWAKRDARFTHDKTHKFKAIDMESPAESTMLSTERQKGLKAHLELLEHAGNCVGDCKLQNCQRMKGFFAHVASCDAKPKKSCRICTRLLALCTMHSRMCTRIGHCPIPFCDRIRARNERLRLQQQLMDERRRQAQNELYAGREN